VRCQPENTIRSMTRKQFQKYLERDRGCWHCGTTGDDLIPHHRQNRGMGGSLLRDVPSNIIALCAEANGLLESNAAFAELGRKFGWKLRNHEIPTQVPVFGHGGWWLLNDDFTKDLVEAEDNLD
jgi:hypothetical protein